MNSAKRNQVRDTPYVKPPFIDVPMGRFLTYLSLGLLALASFYVWRITVWASEVGGYWNLMTGRRDTLVDVVQQEAAKASAREDKFSSVTSASAAGASSGRAARGAACPPCEVPDPSVESLVLQLADKLGVKPVELNAVIRPLLDPSAPQITAEPKADPNEPGILDVFGEALLD
ncbi:hypothetical protein CC85DRAFT_250460 [Cutaneotrichosporon oleaginosum]|uniref:Uncharacterized protein n=1 Tax=Cutaneotrichosporon oleaginosum TaxID=879819 RepID=A0A0J0XFL6_9TREE|nr:uncharacterized protein CC85DRAFT_250460 [Cutaneotrichosporon oleaginosum]KLT39848.1 hypothetical protein CC85DRAFT_250460 [Cutaneotrichosporon oleaginosum]TXT05445.1 hypothetical protein COLE_06765 [Cutaneotrichosporon oleaginosum]